MEIKKIKIKSKVLAVLLMVFSFVVFGASLLLTLVTVAAIFDGASFLFSAFFIVVDISMAWVFFVGMREFTSK